MGKVKNLKIQGGSENNVLNTPCFVFFWNSPFFHFLPDLAHHLTSSVMTSHRNLQIRLYHLFWQILQIRQETTPN